MPRPKAQLRLGAFFNPTGHHVASWRHPDAQADANVNFQHYVEIARTAERGKFDMVFLADNLAMREASMEALSRSAQYISNLEPMTLIAALSAVTSRIGLVCTATTSYYEPYHVARKFATMDHISGGRVGWNLVTSGTFAEAYNFNRDAHYGHAERYDRAREFAEIVVGLWDSWDDDAFVRDKEAGLCFRSGEAAHAQPRRQALQGAGPAQHAAAAAGPSRHRAGRHVRGRHGHLGAVRRGDLQRALVDRSLQEVFKRGEDPRRRQVRPQSRSSQGDARPLLLRRRKPRARRTRNTNTCSR